MKKQPKKHTSLLFFLLIFCFTLTISPKIYAQGDLPELEEEKGNHKSKDELSYKVLYDEPDSLYRFFFTFHALSAEFGGMNNVFGYGFQANYFHKKHWAFQASLRLPYAKSFDAQRKTASETSIANNQPRSFYFGEVVGTYHISDQSLYGHTRLMPHGRHIAHKEWATSVATHIRIPALVRTVLGVRFGGYMWQTAFNVKDVAQRQSISIKAGENLALELNKPVFTNFNSAGIIIGGSYTQIRNIFIKPEGFDPVGNVHKMTFYTDILIAPFMSVEDVTYAGRTYRTDAIDLKNIGSRAGILGLFNRHWGWSYNAEFGWRPAPTGRNFYLMAKIGFTIAENLKHRRKSFKMD